MRVSPATVRRLILRCQGLAGGPDLPAGKEGAARAIERLGHVQIDTISVVCRAHHHTLWSRRADYHPRMLHELQAVDRRVFEYWRRAACYLPMSDYRFYLPAMRAHAAGGRTRGFLDANRELVDGVLARIRAEGGLRSADFKVPDGDVRGPWWDWKPAKHALEALFNTGELMVTERRNFHRVYDLAERVLPADLDTTVPPPDERARFGVRRALDAEGLACGHARGQAPPQAVAELVDAGEVTPVFVRGLPDEVHYADADALAAAARGRSSRTRVHILSPFDNATIDRRRLRALFGFDYKLEAYHPAAKRRYGYFCLPVLWGSDFVARLDAKADRKARTLIVRNLVLEPGLKGDGLFGPLAERLRAFAAFNKCDRAVVEKASPARARSALERELARS